MAKFNIFSASLQKKDGKIIYPKNAEKKLYQEFVNALEDGQKITVYFEAHGDQGFFAQLCKIHACIREIAFEMGQSVPKTKKMIKEMSGLYFEFGDTYYEKSFGHCDSREMTLVIQSIIEAGDAIGINFRGPLPEYQEDQLP